MAFRSPFRDTTMAGLHHRVWEKFGDLPDRAPLAVQEYFWALCSSIIGQQLSEKVAPQIEARVIVVLNNDLSPRNILTTDKELLRGAGLSYSKIQYLKNVAGAWQSGEIHSEQLLKWSDADVIDHLVRIKGVGRWTAEMFLIFTLGRPDVFSVGDYGLKRAMMLAYNLPKETRPEVFLTIATEWQPKRSLASRILWKSLEL